MSLHILRASLVVALLAFSACGTPKSILGSDKIPGHVLLEIARQNTNTFRTADMTGVPLLDPSIDWTRFENWPEEFSFQGHRFRSEYVFFGSDYAASVNSRAQLRPDHGRAISFSVVRTNALPLHSFSSWWSRQGYLMEQSLSWNARSIFSLRFYPDGALFSYARDTSSGRRRVEYYQFGKPVGSINGRTFLWKGRKLTPKEFFRRLGAITRNFPREA